MQQLRSATTEQMLSDYDLARGRFMGFGLVFMLLFMRFLATVAAVIVVLNRKQMFDRRAGTTDVLLHESEPRALAPSHA
jgi:hypothetical protein